MTKKIEKKPVSEVLFEHGICYAVCIASSKFINQEISAFSKDYFVIINKCDEELVKEFTFYPTEGYKQICLRSLSENEIGIFRKNKDKFIKVLHNEYGRVYELKGQQFIATYNCLKPKLKCGIMRNLKDR